MVTDLIGSERVSTEKGWAQPIRLADVGALSLNPYLNPYGM
jgi:hypothetical protein